MRRPTPQQQRRNALLSQMESGIAIIPNAFQPRREDDPSRYTTWIYGLSVFMPDSDFWYLTAFPEPESVLVLIAGAQPQSILFCRPRDEEQELWWGKRIGPEQAQERFGFDACYSMDELDARLPQLMQGHSRLHYAFGADAGWDQRVYQALNQLRHPKASRGGSVFPTETVDIRRNIHAMRRIKDTAEIETMRKAVDISVAAHLRAMRACRAGLYEYQLEAELQYVFRHNGAWGPSYNSIVASGPNACLLHHVDNDRQMQADELVLIDAGARFDGYCADLTRTLPVSGRFTGPQRDIYDLVLSAEVAAIDAIRPGRPMNTAQQTHVRILSQGLLDLGLCQGSLDGVIEREDYKRFYMHGPGHFLGIDTHDAGRYHNTQGEWLNYQPGMTLTVEPGLYIRPADNIPEAFWHIGVRVEDNLLVTEHGVEVLSADLPKSATDIEAIMRDGALH